ncbi:MAG TPA: hypothetical protein VGB08_11735 [Allosphingosinicella sp.]|jgi:hypothetical protein
MILSAALRVLGEMMAQYEGVAPDDPRLEPYRALTEELDIPVGIHMGPGEPAQPYGQQRNIFYNNAARFLRLSPAEISRHHAM